MSKLAIFGGTPAVSGPLAPFNTIGKEEKQAAVLALSEPLSGFLGGEPRGGKHVRTLEERWCSVFGSRFAIACNSATSGLLAACAAAGVEPGDTVVTTPFTMSATAAAPTFLGADIDFVDVEAETFCIDHRCRIPVRAAVVTNLFGHPASVKSLRAWCDRNRDSGVPTALIEDNSQSPWSTENGRYAGTIGHMGVWSLNVHKHMQTGEGGIVTTDDPDLAARLRGFINHGEMAGGQVGLNLRMTELTAAIACVQLAKGPETVARRRAIAERLSAAIRDLPGLTPPAVRDGCTHSYYIWAVLLDGIPRERFAAALRAEGVPLRCGYVAPLYRLPAFADFAKPCPIAEDLHDRRLVLLETCSFDPTDAQVAQIGDAFAKVIEHRNELERVAA